MIFVAVGNWHKGFDRLIQAVDKLKAKNIIRDEVRAQIGGGSYYPKNLSAVRFCSSDEFKAFVQRSRILIAHAGIGTILQALESGKPVVAVPRKAELGECGDNHQLITGRALQKEGKILMAEEISELPDKLKESERFVPVKANNNRNITCIIEAFINDLAKKKTGQW